MKNFKITCKCGRYVTSNNDLYLLNYYKVKIPTLKYASDGRRIIEETFYSYICPECNNDVVVIKRRTLKNNLIPVKLIGLEAIKYLQLTEDNRINKTNMLQYCENPYTGKGIPISYYKTISSDYQRPRYINEAGYSGVKVKSIVEVISKK